MLTHRVLTVPNLLSAVRLAVLPVFAVLVATHRYGPALAVLAAAGASDFVDGWVARRFRQVSALGTVLDPLADRAWMLVAAATLAVAGEVPWVLLVVLLVRDVVLFGLLGWLRRRGIAPLPVHHLGKVATFVLFGGFPLVLLAGAVPQAQWLTQPIAWSVVLWGVLLYWWAAGGYLAHAARVLSARGQVAAP